MLNYLVPRNMLVVDLSEEPLNRIDIYGCLDYQGEEGINLNNILTVL